MRTRPTTYTLEVVCNAAREMARQGQRMNRETLARKLGCNVSALRRGRYRAAQAAFREIAPKIDCGSKTYDEADAVAAGFSCARAGLTFSRQAIADQMGCSISLLSDSHRPELRRAAEAAYNAAQQGMVAALQGRKSYTIADLLLAAEALQRRGQQVSREALEAALRCEIPAGRYQAVWRALERRHKAMQAEPQFARCRRCLRLGELSDDWRVVGLNVNKAPIYECPGCVSRAQKLERKSA